MGQAQGGRRRRWRRGGGMTTGGGVLGGSRGQSVVEARVQSGGRWSAVGSDEGRFCGVDSGALRRRTAGTGRAGQ